MAEIQNEQGRVMKVSELIYGMAKDYGWTSGLADENLAQAMEKIRADKEGNSIGAGQSINGAFESVSIIDFCRHGIAYNPTFGIAATDCPEYREVLCATQELCKCAERLREDFEGEIGFLETQLRILVDKLILRVNVEAMGER